jgi:hypothetical protein
MNRRLPRALLVITTGAFVCASVAGGQQPAASKSRNPHGTAARDHWRFAGRRIPGENSAALRAQAIHQKQQLRNSRSLTSVGSVGAWVSLGPKPLPSDASGSGLQDYGFVSGRATAIAIDPNDASGNTVFIGGAYAGVWKSTNAGALSPDASAVNWTPLTDSQPTLAIGSIAVQPQLSNPNSANSIVLAGTGETDSSSDSYYGLGILRSSDGGVSWSLISQDTTKTHSFAGLGFSQIAFSTTNPNLVVAAAGSASQGIVEGLEDPVGVNRGLYVSNDAGASWQMAMVSDSGTSIGSESTTAVTYNSAAAKFFAAVRYHGFYSSSDGLNWTRLLTQPGAGLAASQCPAIETTPSTCPIYRGAIAVVPKRAGSSGLGEMYAWYVDSNDVDQGIWTSSDGGSSWTQIDDSGITNCGDLLGGCGTENGTFNLTLAAVPDGPATDLYAGAANIYKCQINVLNATCSGTGNNTFLNLTHVYGCSDIAKVHPAQHAMDFLAANGTSLLYFANDGGIYRALDGYTGLTTGTCGGTNLFDDLNQSLGPMTQFVSVAQSSTDANVIFGGTEGNGVPATAFSQSLGPWVNVDAGDNGFAAVNPADENQWFLATPPNSLSGVNLFSCSNGVNCHSADFQNNPVADSNSLDGDAGPYDLPFLLDPQNSSSVILGTCRIWRGSTAGGSFSLLSPDFETGGTGSCSGDEINLVRSIAAGGPTDANGLSQVIFTGTNGEGPLISTIPQGGHVWVTTNADGGPLTWADVTQGINPLGFPISSIALDSTDPLGKTAYAAIMGFHTSHVWKTTNAGTSWIDYSANLPDAPVNSIVIDSGASLSSGTVYVGTDVGVFATSTASANWAEVGPASGQSGFLPNVAVTSLKIFNSGGLKRFRAATYGRGIWEWNLITTPDFGVSVANNPLTVSPAQTATFSGTLLALNGYSSNVNLSCTAGATSPPQNCSVKPVTLLPNTAGASFTVKASGSIADYQFNLHAVGTDLLAVTHDLPLTLHIVDFTLGTPAPNTVTVGPGGTSSPVSLQVSALGSFSGSVSLSCSNLPAGATCQFQPSSSVSPTSGNPSTVTLTIGTAAVTPSGTFPIAVSAAVAGLPAKTQTLTLIVSAAPDYGVTIANTSLSGNVNTSATFNGTLMAINGYGSLVSLSCGTGAPPVCTPNPANATPTAAGTPFTVTVSSDTAQSYNFNVIAAGSGAGTITHSVALTYFATVSQGSDFSISASPTTDSITAGQTAQFTVTLIPTSGAFASSVALSCSGLPALANCTFNPASVGSGSGESAVALSITTEGAAGGNCGIVEGTPAGTYNISVTGATASSSHSAPITLIVQPPAFDFCVDAPKTASVAAGSSVPLAVTVTSNDGSFPSPLTFSCSNLPALTTCSFNPAQIATGSSSPATTSLTVSTTSPVAASVVTSLPFLSGLWFGAFIWRKQRRRSKMLARGMAGLALIALLGSLSCGGGLQGNGGGGGSGSPGTPPGTYTITVNATSGAITHNTQIALTVTP